MQMSALRTTRGPLPTLLISALFALWLPGVAFCEETDTVEMNGFVSGYAATGNRDLDDERDLVGTNGALQSAFRYAEHQKAFLDLRYFSDKPLSGKNVREAYLALDLGNLNTRIGKQVLVWGRADTFNPTDVITPRDYEVLSSDDDDQRFGMTGVRARYAFSSSLSLEAVALPRFQSSAVPSGLLPAGTDISREHERYSRDNAQGGVKLDSSGERIDWSLSWFKGFSLLPELALNERGGLVLQNRKMEMIGADFAAALGEWVVRGEAARVTFKKPEAIPEIYPHSYLYTVLGVEKNLWDTLTLNVQWLHRYLYDFNDPEEVPGPLGQIALGNAVIHNQFDKRQDGATGRLSERWLNDTLQAEVAGVYFFNRHDYLVRPKVQYTINDHWKAVILADVYRGPENSFLGSFHKNSLTFTELRYQF